MKAKKTKSASAGWKRGRSAKATTQKEKGEDNKRGRPSKYDPKYVDALIAYFESFLDQPYTKEVIKTTTAIRKDGSEFHTTEYKLVAKPLPSLFLFAKEIGVSYWTVHHWATARVGEAPDAGESDERPFLYPDFSQAYKSREMYQEAYLHAVAMPGISNPSWSIFTAKNVLGWRDTQDQRMLDAAGNPMTPSYVLLPMRLDAAAVEEEYDRSTEAGASK